METKGRYSNRLAKSLLKYGLGTAAFLVFCNSMAKAQMTWDWSFSGTADSGSGIITTQDTTSQDGLFTGYLALTITGLFDGNSIQALDNPGSYRSNDNLVSDDLAKQLDGDGISFQVNAPGVGSENVNIYFSTGTYGAFSDRGVDSFGTFSASPTPEPSVWTLLALGVLGAGGILMRRNIRKSA